MSLATLSLADEYRATLRAHIRHPDVATLGRACELGHRALNESLGIALLTQVYREELGDALHSASSVQQAVIAAEAAGQFFTELLSPYEIRCQPFHQGHAALGASEERYRHLFENTSDIIFTLDLSGNLISGNRRAEELTGYRIGEDFPLTLAGILAPECSPLARQIVEEQRKRPSHRAYEAEILTKDGRRLMVEVRTRLIYEDERPVGIHGIVRDVSQHKRAEQQFHDLLESAPDVMLLATLDGKILYVNAQVEHVFGYQPAELIGKSVEVLVPPRFRERHAGHLAAFVGAHQRRPMGTGFSLFGVRKDGHEFPTDISLCHLHAEEGTLLIATIRDITNDKKTQQALQEMNVALEQEARRIAQVLHDESGQLLAAAHVAIEAMAETAPAPMRKHIEEVTRLLNQTEEQVRELSHELRPTILDDLGLRPALEFLARAASSRTGMEAHVDCQIEYRLPPPIETAIYRVTQEALMNVLRHADARHVSVRVEQRDGSIWGSIRDDGKGFDTKSLFQSGGTGLGLIGMRARMSSVGGKLVVSSRPGQGTDIRFSIQEGESCAD